MLKSIFGLFKPKKTNLDNGRETRLEQELISIKADLSNIRTELDDRIDQVGKKIDEALKV